ncbi:hypothetical protein K501DRAFT_230535, partial [Backusella circina FSU 941]
MGSDIAEFQLGFMYHFANGVNKDYFTAFLWYLKAARQFNKDAWFRIAQMFDHGDGVFRNQYKALEWFYRCNKNSAQVIAFERRGFHLTKHDKKRSIYQLIEETEDIVNAEMVKDRERQNKLLQDGNQ